MHADGRTVMLEVVSEAADAELRSIEAARTLGVDWILGGTHAEEALAILAGSPARYCPFPGTIVGHPSLLRGTVESIAADAARLTALDGVHGLDLLAYRFDGDVEAAVAATVAASSGPVIAAGSVDSPERIRTLGAPRRLGLHHRWRHLRGPLPGAPGVADQVREVLRITAEADAARLSRGRRPRVGRQGPVARAAPLERPRARDRTGDMPTAARHGRPASLVHESPATARVAGATALSSASGAAGSRSGRRTGPAVIGAAGRAADRSPCGSR